MTEQLGMCDTCQQEVPVGMLHKVWNDHTECKDTDKCPRFASLEAAAEKDAEDQYYREGRYSR